MAGSVTSTCSMLGDGCGIASLITDRAVCGVLRQSSVVCLLFTDTAQSSQTRALCWAMPAAAAAGTGGVRGRGELEKCAARRGRGAAHVPKKLPDADAAGALATQQGLT